MKDSYLRELFKTEISTVTCKNKPCSCACDGCEKIVLSGGKRTYLTDIFTNPSFDRSFNYAAQNLIPKIQKEWEKIFKIFITTCCCNNSKIIGVN